MKIDRQKVYEKCQGHCAYCGITLDIKDMQVDHIRPKWNFHEQNLDYDVNDFKNLNPSCRSCNNYKGGNPLHIFRKYVEDQINILRKSKPTFRMAERFGLIECHPQNILFYFEK